LSQTGMMGTPAYMSPEQARGDKTIDGRADLYGLGAVLYHMLSGQLPYESDTPMGMALKHVSEPPPTLTQFRPDLPPGVDAVIVKAMAKDPAARYASAAEMVAGLRAVLAANASQRTVTPPPNPPPTVVVNPSSLPGAGSTSAAAPAQPGRLPVVALVLGALGLLAVGAVVLFVITALAIYGPRGGTTATPRPSPSVPVVVASVTAQAATPSAPTAVA